MTDSPTTIQPPPGRRQQRIQAALHAAFAPSRLELVDESAQHAGHRGVVESGHDQGESHFALRIAAASLQNLSRLEQHRRINQALAVEFAGGLHALRITVVQG
ncbi:MAG: BolA family transcriptional regulator [Alphaproteobacteria bacterium]|nr:BolA family transcriptional regulator [Alphaproteobacteria bacterium]